jgi:hypothetical protein
LKTTHLAIFFQKVSEIDNYEVLRTTAALLKTAQAELDRILAECENLRAPELRASVDLGTTRDSARRRSVSSGFGLPP